MIEHNEILYMLQIFGFKIIHFSYYNFLKIYFLINIASELIIRNNYWQSFFQIIGASL